ncbi:SAP domain-containing protein [Pseudomonadota bacterium]
MKLPAELSIRAITNGVFITKDMTKTRLVRHIQRSEGDAPCFRTDIRDTCRESSATCEWADKCKDALIAQWKR